MADPRARFKMTPLDGEVPSPASPPSGCYFHPRCPYSTELCLIEYPVLKQVSDNHFVSCHRHDELQLAGVD